MYQNTKGPEWVLFPGIHQGWVVAPDRMILTKQNLIQHFDDTDQKYKCFFLIKLV